jgi:glycosyltransferase involved in cell wall biosynthesis
MNYAKELLKEAEFELVVFDDHSDDETIDELKKNLNIATFKTQLIHLETHGIMPSILRCYEHGRDHGRDIVYFAQDDYLYDTKCIYDMIMTMYMTSNNLGNFTCIYPYDDPYKYIPENTAVQSHIIRNQGRHWRTLPMTASCFMVHHQVLTKEWDLFEAMGKSRVHAKMEDNSINQLFRTRGYYLFVPIPSLALHMQYDTEMDDQIDWRKWWDKYARPEPLQPTTDKTVLNVGSGGVKLKDELYTEVFEGMREISLDIDGKYNPDILADVTEISHIPDGYVDNVYTSHMLEHIDYFKVPVVINELLRICKQDGYIRAVVPNVQVTGENIARGDLLSTMYDSPGGPVAAIDILYGGRWLAHKNQNDFMRHKTGFTVKVFEALAKEHGFDMQIKDEGFNLVVDIKK